jgi:Antitoxin VbhA
MTTSDKERVLRLKAVQSALASVQLAGLQPSQHLESLFASWIAGESTLDQVYDSLLAKVRTTND